MDASNKVKLNALKRVGHDLTYPDWRGQNGAVGRTAGQ